MAPVYRIQHVGSLIRPQVIIDITEPLRATPLRLDEGTVEQKKQIQAVTENCIRDVVKEQIERGITPITSGEFERSAYIAGLFENLSGFELQSLPVESDIWRPHNPFNIFYKLNETKEREAYVAIDKIKRGSRSPYVEEWSFLRTCLPENQWKNAKITVITPLWWYLNLNKPYTDGSYENDEAYLVDIVDALRGEILDLYNEGLRNVQVDDPILVWFYIPSLKEKDPNIERLMDLCIKAHERLTRDLPSDLTISHHVCRGNVPGDPDWMNTNGGYEDVAARLFKGTHYNQFLLEHTSSKKHGDFEFAKYLGKDQVLVLGLVNTKFEELEDIELLKKRVVEVAKIVAKAQGRDIEEVLRENIAISPQCGFASGMNFVPFTIERQWEKLKLLQELASQVWPQQ